MYEKVEHRERQYQEVDYPQTFAIRIHDKEGGSLRERVRGRFEGRGRVRVRERARLGLGEG